MTAGGPETFAGKLPAAGLAGATQPETRPAAAPSAMDRLRSVLSGGDVAVTCFVFSLVVATACRGCALLAALGFCLALTALVYPAGLTVLARRRTWILLIMIVVSSTLIGPDPVWTLGPFGLSMEGALQGANMVMRALIIIPAVTGLVSSVPIDRIGAFLEHLGLRGLGFAVGVAFNLLPMIEHSLATSWHAMRLRAGLRRPLAAARLMLIVAVTSCLRCADEVAVAAEARAFSPDAKSGERLVWRRRVAPLAVTLAVVAAALAQIGP